MHLVVLSQSKFGPRTTIRFETLILFDTWHTKLSSSSVRSKKILTLMRSPYLESQIFMKYSYLALNNRYLLCVETCKEVKEKLNISLIFRRQPIQDLVNLLRSLQTVLLCIRYHPVTSNRNIRKEKKQKEKNYRRNSGERKR